MLEVGQLIADGLDLGCVFFRNHGRAAAVHRFPHVLRRSANGVTRSQGGGSLVTSPSTGQHNARRARRHQDRRPHQHHPRALRHHAAGRPGRRRHQGRGAGGRRGAPHRQAGQDARHGPDLSLREPQQALALPRPQEQGGAGGAPEGGRRRRCLRPCAAAAGHRGPGAGLRGDPQDQARHRLCRRLRLFGRRSLRKTAGLRRCHPGPLRHRRPDGPGGGRRRAPLSADHPGRQDGGAHLRLRHSFSPYAPTAHRRGPVRRGADVRDHGRLADGRASVGAHLQRRGRGRLLAAAGPHPQALPHPGRLDGDPALQRQALEQLLRDRRAGPRC